MLLAAGLSVLRPESTGKSRTVRLKSRTVRLNGTLDALSSHKVQDFLPLAGGLLCLGQTVQDLV